MDITQLLEELKLISCEMEKKSLKRKDYGLHGHQIFLLLEKQHDIAMAVLLMKMDGHC